MGRTLRKRQISYQIDNALYDRFAEHCEKKNAKVNVVARNVLKKFIEYLEKEK